MGGPGDVAILPGKGACPHLQKGHEVLLDQEVCPWSHEQPNKPGGIIMTSQQDPGEEQRER